jgi:hypothetical protein
LQPSQGKNQQASLQPSLLPLASLASLSVLPGSNEARKMTATSGLKLSQLLKPSSPPGCCLKMLLESSTWHSTRCYLTWKVRVTPQKRLLFQLAPSTPGIDETEFGLWPTATAAERENDVDAIPSEESLERFANGEIARIRKTRAPTLATAVKMWASPRAGNPGSRPNQKGGKVLAEEVKKLLPTPNAWDWEVPELKEAWDKRAAKKRDKGINLQKGLNDLVVHKAQEEGKGMHWKTTGQLNPNFVEWLMNFPKDWTKVD